MAVNKVLEELNRESAPNPSRRKFLAAITLAGAITYAFKDGLSEDSKPVYVKIKKKTADSFKVQYKGLTLALELMEAFSDDGPLALIYRANDPQVKMNVLFAYRARDLFNFLYSGNYTLKRSYDGKQTVVPSILENLADGQKISVPFKFASTYNLRSGRLYFIPTPSD